MDQSGVPDWSMWILCQIFERDQKSHCMRKRAKGPLITSIHGLIENGRPYCMNWVRCKCSWRHKPVERVLTQKNLLKFKLKYAWRLHKYYSKTFIIINTQVIFSQNHKIQVNTDTWRTPVLTVNRQNPRWCWCNAVLEPDSLLVLLREAAVRSVRVLTRRPDGDLQERLCRLDPAGFCHQGGVPLSGPRQPRLQPPEEHQRSVPAHLKGQEPGCPENLCVRPPALQPSPVQAEPDGPAQSRTLLRLCPPVGEHDSPSCMAHGS